MLTHPNITLSINHLDEHDLFLNGFCRDGFNGDQPDIVYLCYRIRDHRITRVTIVKNPYLTMAKQQKGELFIFKAVNDYDSKRCANEAIIHFQTGQRLFGVVTLRQAIIKIHKFDKNFDNGQIEKWVGNYNRDFGLNEKIYQYGHRKYISKDIVSSIVDYLDFCSHER